MTMNPIEGAFHHAATCLFGAILIDPANAFDVRRQIPKNIFANHRDRHMYQAILEIEWPDLVQVRHYFAKHGDYDMPKSYVAEIIKKCPSCCEYQHYIDACLFYAEKLEYSPSDIVGGTTV